MWRLLWPAAAMVAVLGCFVGAAQSRTTAVTLVYPSTGACAPSATGLNDCIASATDGSTIVVKPGTYRQHTIMVGHAVTIKGSCGSTIVDGTATGAAVFAHDAFVIGSSNVKITCVTVRHANYGINDSADGEGTGGFDNLTVTSATFRGVHYAIGLDGGANDADIEKSSFTGTAEKNIFLGPSDTVTSNDHGKVINNTFVNLYYDAVESHAPSDGWTISGNKVTNVDDNVFDWSAALTNSQITGNTISGAFQPITLAAGSNGDTVSKNTFTGVTYSGSSSSTAAIYVAGNGTDVTGNTFSTTVGGAGSVIYVAGDDATVGGNMIKQGSTSRGIWVDGGGPIFVQGNTLAGSYGGNALEVDCEGLCDGSVVSKNTVASDFGSSDGIRVNDVGHCSVAPACMTVSGNTVTNIGGYGLKLLLSDSTISGNKATGGGSWLESSGFFINGNENDIHGNTAMKNAWDGFSLLGVNNLFTANTATGNGLDGIDVGEPIHGNSASGATLNKNIVSKNEGDGIRVYDSTGANSITVTNSNVSGSGGLDCVIHDATSLNPISSGNVCKDGSNFAQTETYGD